MMDNLLAAGKVKPMLIIMDNLNAVKPGEDASLYSARSIIARRSMDELTPPNPGPGAARPGFPSNFGGTFTGMMFPASSPLIRQTSGVLPGRENRATAG